MSILGLVLLNISRRNMGGEAVHLQVIQADQIGSASTLEDCIKAWRDDLKYYEFRQTDK